MFRLDLSIGIFEIHAGTGFESQGPLSPIIITVSHGIFPHGHIIASQLEIHIVSSIRCLGCGIINDDFLQPSNDMSRMEPIMYFIIYKIMDTVKHHILKLQ